MRRVIMVVAALATLASRQGSAQGSDWVRSHYAKSEYRISMRDGVHLFTAVYVPRNASGRRSFPILLTRTPYGLTPYGERTFPEALGPSEAAAREGFIFVYQDVRGRWMSEGKFVDVRPTRAKRGPHDSDEATDAYDTIEWLVRHVGHNNGRVGVWGISYPGFYAAMALLGGHPALVAASPQAPIADWFVGDDFHHNGAFFLPHAFNFYAWFGRVRTSPTREASPPFDHGTADGYRFFLELGPIANADRKYLKGRVPFWNEVLAHEAYDAFWQARNLRPHLTGVKAAVLIVGGWFDAEDLFGALEVYKGLERQNPGLSNRLVMGPWTHGGWARTTGQSLGAVSFSEKTSERYQREIELPFFTRLLKDGRDPGLAEATVFETGKNVWRSFATWPPPEVKPQSYYLAAAETLSPAAPTTTADPYDEYVSDPARPVPFTQEITIGLPKAYMVEDQRFAARRPDVLVYETPPLDEDLSVAGPIGVALRVSTTGTDADFIVKLIDVHPDRREDTPAAGEDLPHYSPMGGYQQLVRGEPFRAKFRKGFDRPTPIVPGAVEAVEFTMPDVCHRFLRGHRVMVQIQSSWFPLVDRNPQRFVEIPTAREADFQKATHRIWRSPEDPSFITLGVLPD